MAYCLEIIDTLRQAHLSFGTKNSGENKSRYKSWEYCHKVFLELHKVKKFDELSDDDFDYLALNLAFYLASWGMYRGSSFLLDRDYRTHIPCVKEIMKERYNPLWDYEPSHNNIDEVKELIFSKPNDKDEGGIYWLIKNELYKIKNLDSYSANVDSKINIAKNDVSPTDTLITKILLGTFACIPAFDQFFKEGCKLLKPKINSNLEKTKTNCFERLCEFVMRHRWELQFISSEIYYPPMKCLDLLIWRLGLKKELLKMHTKSANKNKVSEIIVDENFFDKASDISNQIVELNWEEDCDEK